MPEQDSEQQRFKTKNQLLLERRSIEIEINQLIEERGGLDKKYASLDQKIIDQIKQKFTAIEKFGRERLGVEEKLAEFTEEHRKAIDSLKPAIASQIQEQERLLRDLEARASIEKLEQGLLEEQLKNQRELIHTDESRMSAILSYLGKLGDITNSYKTHFDKLKSINILQGKSLAITAGIATVLQLTFETFKQMDESLAKFRIGMGLFRKDSVRIADDIKNIATQFANVGVTVEGAAEATGALAMEFGGTVKISKDLVETTALLKSQLGVAEESSVGFLRNISALSRSTAQVQRHMVFVASELSSAAGVPLNMVMQDVAKMSGNALAMISKMPMAIVKSAVAARQMGTTINKMADASANLLNFTESVQAEMEASVLVGEAVNIQQARMLAYQGKIVESTKAIVAEARRINFERLDFFQMQAFATASGRSVDELLKLIQAQKQMEAARGIDSLKDEINLLDKINAQKDADLRNDALQAEMMVQREANQARMTALTQQWNQLLMETLKVLFPVFEGFLKAATFAVKFLPLITVVGTAIVKIASGLKFVGAIATKLGPVLGALRFALPFARAIPVIGWIITAIQLLVSGIQEVKKYFTDFANMSWGERILKGLTLGPRIIFRALGLGFVWDWVDKNLFGHSPSKLAMGILNGILAAQTMIFDALTWPFRHFLAWVAEKIPGMGGVAAKLRSGLSGALSPADVAAEGPTGIESKAVSAAATSEEQKQKEKDSTTLSSILDAIVLLNNNLASGKIGVYIDGQLMSAQLARQTAFRGGYGMNNV